MEPTVLDPKREHGIYQGTPDAQRESKNDELSTQRLIRTMRSDVAEAIKKQNETSVSIAIAEDEKRAQERVNYQTRQVLETAPPPAQKRIGRIFIVSGISLTIIATVLAYIFILPRLKDMAAPNIPNPAFGNSTGTSSVQTTTVISQLAPSLIPAQNEKRFNISKETPVQVFAAIATELGRGNPATSIKNLYFMEESGSVAHEVSATRFLSFANINAPEIITRSLEKPFMVGFFGERNGGATPFLVLKVSEHDTGLAGMLEWETGLPYFLDTIFGTRLADSLTATTKFHDIISSGKDARILEIPQGSTVAYAFANQNTIVITESSTSLETLLLLAAKN